MVGKNIAARRKMNRYSQEEIAFIVTEEFQRLTGKEQKFHQSTISDIERGERALKIDELAAFANVFKCLPSELLEGSGE